MKNSYLLNCLVASLRENIRVISSSQHDVFVVDLVDANFYSIRDGLQDITKKDDKDAFVTKHYSNYCYKLKMDFYAKKTRNLSKVQYVTIIKNVIDAVIDNAARQGYTIAEPDAAPVQELEPEVGAVDERQAEQNSTPGDVQTPPTLSLADINKIVGLLEGITAQINEILKIIKNGTKSNV